MSPQPSESITRRDTLEGAVLVLGLSGVVAAGLAAYFAMPVSEFDVSTLWRALLLVLLAMGLVVALFIWTLYRLPAVRRPLWRAVSVVVVLLMAFVLSFAYIYLSLQSRDPGQVPGVSTHLDALYFTMTLVSTVGFGDIAPAGQAARAVATAQMAFSLLFLGYLARTAIAAGRRERERRMAASSAESDGGQRSAE